MLQKNKLTTLLIGLFLLATISDSFSQRRSSRERPSSRDRDVEQTESISFTDRLAYDIYIGNIGFNNGLTLSAKAGAGYKIFDPLTVGVGAKISYQNVDNFGVTDDFSYTGFGYFPYLRYRIVDEFYVKAEYNFFNVTYKRDVADNAKANFSFPMLGGGYAQGFGKWKLGVELLFMLNNTVLEDTPFRPQPEKSDLYSFFEYNISFLYNL